MKITSDSLDALSHGPRSSHSYVAGGPWPRSSTALVTIRPPAHSDHAVVARERQRSPQDQRHRQMEDDLRKAQQYNHHLAMEAQMQWSRALDSKSLQPGRAQSDSYRGLGLPAGLA